MSRSSSQVLLTVGVGDIHGRFHRVQAWLDALEQARGRGIDLTFAVGDVEAFRRADDHRRKAAKRQMPAEFADYVEHTRTLTRPLHFIGGNNEDFESLHALQSGGMLIDGVHYLGRSGVACLEGLRVGFLSGIYAPKHYQTPLLPPTSRETHKHAGYFRESEVQALAAQADVDLLLVHEWPKGLVLRRKGVRPLRAYRFPWVGSPVTTRLLAELKPRWVWCGHSHVPFAATVSHPGGPLTRVACLDQASRPEGAIFWLEWEGGAPKRGGFGISGQVDWREDDSWDERQVPADPPPEDPASDVELNAPAGSGTQPA